MLTIAICNDLEQENYKLKELLIQIQIRQNFDFEIDIFKNSQKLNESLLHKRYNLILLNIVMTGVYQTEIIDNIRLTCPNTLIILISDFDISLKKICGINILGLLDRPIDTIKVEEYINQVLSIKNNKNNFSYQKQGYMYYLSVDDIVYCEVSKNNIIIYLYNNEIHYRGTLKKAWEQLQNHNNFIMPNRAYIINLQYAIVTPAQIELKKLYNLNTNIGRTYKEETLNRYHNYFKKETSATKKEASKKAIYFWV
ncbi:hypothetical protein AN641_04995 [Candidatus Epulonipiscioides gigas]|nr:hypothetical protein AN641_04995 [Epulopiscium sp. SCG-C07WGA-EpuloA2]